MVVVGPLAMGAAALVAIVAAGVALAHRRVGGAVATVAALVGVATACLAWALVGVDGRLAYVADTTSRSSTWPYRLSALWGGMDGSLLFWAALLSVVAVLGCRSVRRRRPDLEVGAAGVLLGLIGAFLAVGLAFADPFDALAIPAVDGAGLAPILEHPAMLYHPPLLYLGLITCAVPFAVAAAGLASASCDEAWLRLVRHWAGLAWLALTVGMLAGSHWAYVELGWGGFWAWDPVENAALLPWLGSTALVHVAMVDEHRCRVRTSTATLAMATFVLALIGSVLARSGAASSVHAFAEARAVGWALLAVVVVVAAATVWLSRSNRRRSPPGGARPRRGRQRALAANLVLLLGLVAVVTFGTLFPLVAELTGGEAFVVSGRYFAVLSAPLALAVLALVGVAPALRWSGGLTAASRRLVAPAAAGAALVGLVVAAGGGRRPFAVAAAPLATFSAVLLVAELVRRLRAPGPLGARRRSAGAVLAHLGVVVTLAGIAGSTGGVTETVVVADGGRVEVAGYSLDHGGVAVVPAAVARRLRFEMTLSRSGEVVAVLNPEQVVDEDRGLVLAETALHSTALEDVLVAVRRVADDGTAVLEVSVRPLVVWVWWGAILVATGGALALLGGGTRSVGRRPAMALAVEQATDGGGDGRPLGRLRR
ncbi:MAG: cytochrome c biogenesis protein CcsA [Actinobacteria bacterium]|nr:cytochrome c biogenesis protein CcsA [Actinomycetota bacterium]